MVTSMRITARIVSVGLLSLTLFAGSASAAWVLWVNRITFDDEVSFERLGAFGTKGECMKASRARADAVFTAGREAYRTELLRGGARGDYLEGAVSATMTIHLKESGWEVVFPWMPLGPDRSLPESHSLAFECWPDTVDPRPKERWVLWGQVGELIGDSNVVPYSETRYKVWPKKWASRSVHSSQAACERAGSRAFNKEDRALNARLSWIFECWPDTVDPRGPKAK